MAAKYYDAVESLSQKVQEQSPPEGAAVEGHVARQPREVVEEVSWTPLELFAISTRLQSPLPPQDPDSKRTDFTNVADQVGRHSNFAA